MAYWLRVGTNKYNFSSLDEMHAQEVLKNAFIHDNLIYCLCRRPNPILTLSKQSGLFKPMSMIGTSLIQHDHECFYGSHADDRSNATKKTKEDINLESLWVISQLNIWTPKMTAKRNEALIVKVVTKAAITLGVTLYPLSHFEEQKTHEKTDRYYFGFVGMNNNHKTIFEPHTKFVQQTTHTMSKIRSSLNGFKQPKTCLLIKVEGGQVSDVQYLLTEKNYLPLDTLRVKETLEKIIKSVRLKKRFYISFQTNEVVEF